MPHGFDDDEPTRLLLRSDPPQRALAWAGRALHGSVVSAVAVQGGMSSAMHRLQISRTNGTTCDAMLRRHVRPEDVLEDPDIAEMEARALGFIAPVSVSTPELIAVDREGAYAGVPSVLMTVLPGQIKWDPVDRPAWLRGMAETITVIHSVSLPAPGLIRPYEVYGQEHSEPPPWTRRPAVWQRAIELFQQRPPTRRRAFIHRDYHPGNVLWQHDHISGVVDWEAASVGPPDIDIGHCRANLAQYGHEVLEEFTCAWERAAGLTYDPWADIGALIGSLDGFHESPGPDRLVVEDLLAAAVAELK